MNTPNIYQKAYNTYKYLFGINIIYIIYCCYTLINESIIYDNVAALAVPNELDDIASLNFAYELTNICEASLFNFHFEMSMIFVIWISYTILFYVWWFRMAQAAKKYAPSTTSNIKPGFFIGSFFIPILSWFYPYTYIKRIFNIFCRPSDSQHNFSLLVIIFWITYAITTAITSHQIRNGLKEVLRPSSESLTLAEVKSEILHESQISIINQSIDLISSIAFAFILYYIAQSLISIIDKHKNTASHNSEIPTPE